MKHLTPYTLYTTVSEDHPTKTLQFWHGGKLDQYDDTIAQKNGRYEYGPGLYLTTHLPTARKYAKGGRRLYRVTVESGTDIDKTFLPIKVVEEFVRNYVIGRKRKDIVERIREMSKDGETIRASLVNNVLLNEKGIKSVDTPHLREFWITNGIDYEIVNNPFGWGEDMMVLYNMKKIINVEIITPKTQIEEDDLRKVNDRA